MKTVSLRISVTSLTHKKSTLSSALFAIGAGEENRTLTVSLEG